jgi:hypothetical protein
MVYYERYMPQMNYLVVIETQRVKGYLFASPVLRETRGASMLLDKLNRKKTGELLIKYSPHEYIYLGGGSGRILFENFDKAQEFANEVRDLYSHETTNARVSVEICQRFTNEIMSAWIARGVSESQKNKLARIEAKTIIAGRWIRPCSSCGKEPAEIIPKPDIQGNHQLCLACSQKRDEIFTFYQKEKRNWDIHIPLPELDQLFRNSPNSILTTLSQKIESKFGKGIRTLLPQDFNQIGEESKPANYIGFIYADGNRMGETIKEIGRLFPDDDACKRAYRVFSEIVDQSTREAAVIAVLEHVICGEWKTENGEDARYVPVEFVLAGGDDLMLVTPGDLALPVATSFIEHFQMRTKELQQERSGELLKPFAEEGLTISAGVVLAHSTFPASQLVDFAGDLMKLAKHKSAGLKTKMGTLDFCVLHESGSENMKERRKNEYTRKFDKIEVSLTERPYAAPEMAKLLERIRALKDSGVPYNKLKALYPVLFQEILQAQFDALRIKERLKAAGNLIPGKPLEKLVRELKLFPFRECCPTKWSTPLSEMIEIYDFIHSDN